VAAVTGVIAVLDQHTQSASLVVLYLLAVLPVAVHWGAPFGALVSVLSTATFDFFFVAPRNSFTPGDSGAWLDLGVFVVAALVVSELAGRSRRQAHASARLAEEQAALRRVATLVARAVPPSEVFETVTREIGLLSDADFARMERYEDDGTVTGVAAWTRHDDPRLAVGTRFVLSGVSIAARVRDTRGAVRVDSFTGASGPIAEEARATGIRSSVGCPIWVGGELWGVIAASSKREGTFPPDMEAQMPLRAGHGHQEHVLRRMRRRLAPGPREREAEGRERREHLDARHHPAVRREAAGHLQRSPSLPLRGRQQRR